MRASLLSSLLTRPPRWRRTESSFALADAPAVDGERTRRAIPLNATLLSLTHAQVDGAVHRDAVNGVAIVSQGPRLPIASLALSIPAGSAHERRHVDDRCDAGVSQLYRHALLKSNAFRSEQFMTRYFEENGVRIGTERSRSRVLVRADGPQGSLSDVAEMVLKTVSHFCIKEHELASIRELGKIENAMAGVQPAKLLLDLAYQAAYPKAGLGNPLYTPDGQLECIGKSQLDAFAQAVIGTAGHTLVGVGVDEELFKAMLDSFGYHAAAKDKKRAAKFAKASELCQHDVFQYEHDHAALFWESDDIRSAQLFCHFYRPQPKVPFGVFREPLGPSLGAFVHTFYEHHEDGAMYGLMFKFPRGLVSPGRIIENALDIVRKTDETGDALEFAQLALEQEKMESMSSQYQRMTLFLNDDQVDAKAIQMPSAHRKAKAASLVVLGDTRRLPRLSDLQ